MSSDCQVTAIIYDKRGGVLSIGKNSYVKTHPYQARLAKQLKSEHKIFIHAEIDAILKCRNLNKAHRISIFRADKSGGYKLVRPCAICQTAISKTPIRVVDHA
jgi:deoxycytidylate deaminase